MLAVAVAIGGLQFAGCRLQFAIDNKSNFMLVAGLPKQFNNLTV